MRFDIDGLDELQENIQQAVQKGVDELNKGIGKFNESVSYGGSSNKSASNESEYTTCPNCSARLVSLDNGVKKCEYCGATFGTAKKNTNRSSMMDSVFDFVERQQKLNMETQAQKLENERIKAELKIKRLERYHKRRAVRKLIGIVILVILGYYCYTHQDVVNAVLQIVSEEFM